MFKREKVRLFLVSVSLLSTLLFLLSACGAQGTPTSQSPANANPVKGGTWIDDVANEPSTLIPNGSSLLIQNALYAPPFYGDTQGQITPGIVPGIPTVQNGGISSDYKTYTFKLLPNLKWSDGQPLNADDMDFTWKLRVNPKFGSYSTNGYNQIDKADVSSDKQSITFHLKQPFAAFLSI